MSFEVTRHPVGSRASDLKPGDFILVHSFGKLAPRLIGFGQKLHHKPEFSYWTHAAVYIGPHPDDEKISRFYDQDWLIEAKGGQKVRAVSLSQYDARDYAAVHFDLPPDSPMRENAVGFTHSRLGEGYGYWTILSLAIWSLFGGRLTLGLSGGDVCSGLAAQNVMYLGEIFSGDAVETEPADLAQKYNVRR